MRKNVHAAALGRLGGLKGGKSTSPAKLAAVRKNLALARKKRLADLKKPVDSFRKAV